MKFAPDSKCTCSCFGQLSNAPNARDPNSIPNRSRKICIEVCHIKRILQVVEDPGQLDLPLNAARFALTRFASPTPVSVHVGLFDSVVLSIDKVRDLCTAFAYSTLRYQSLFARFVIASCPRWTPIYPYRFSQHGISD